ncbi:hypothetical protein HPB50_012551 [Hyalomma asiaticum]|uniref:Uncharacterized protein n=1 Tax=Hyalomma asiaticum TaxID=266040 RepID=A0ACB7RKG1_HYAAI|nr:hypothetical protein HPB50_012551 [Hyalomma asiaticum]
MVKVGGKEGTFKVGTGFRANLVLFGKFKMGALNTSDPTLRSYGGGIIKRYGKCKAPVQVSKRNIIAEFFLVKKVHQAILGLQSNEKLGLLHRAVESVTIRPSSEVVRQFSRLFQETGCLRGEYDIRLLNDAVRIVEAAQRIPIVVQ